MVILPVSDKVEIYPCADAGVFFCLFTICIYIKINYIILQVLIYVKWKFPLSPSHIQYAETKSIFCISDHTQDDLLLPTGH